MREIPLKGGGVASVDDGDYEYVSRWRWSKGDEGYAIRWHYIGRVNGKKRKTKILMHRLIMGYVDGVQYDHINGNRLDNRRSNLRVATKEQNGWNSVKRRDQSCTSKYKGVYWKEYRKKHYGRWHARVRQSGRDIHCGFFGNPIDAAIAYDKKVREMRGEFGRYNFPRDGEQSAVA